MKFIVLVTANKDTSLTAVEFERYEAGALAPSEEFVKMIAYQEELVKAGVLVAGEGLRPSSLGARMTFGKDGERALLLKRAAATQN